jgi:hypothetical protein
MHRSTFDYLSPTTEQTQRMQRIRDAANIFCEAIDQAVPDGPDKTYAIRLLRTLAMWCNVSITRQPDGAPRQ